MDLSFTTHNSAALVTQDADFDHSTGESVNIDINLAKDNVDDELAVQAPQLCHNTWATAATAILAILAILISTILVLIPQDSLPTISSAYSPLAPVRTQETHSLMVEHFVDCRVYLGQALQAVELCSNLTKLVESVCVCACMTSLSS